MWVLLYQVVTTNWWHFITVLLLFNMYDGDNVQLPAINWSIASVLQLQTMNSLYLSISKSFTQLLFWSIEKSNSIPDLYTSKWNIKSKYILPFLDKNRTYHEYKFERLLIFVVGWTFQVIYIFCLEHRKYAPLSFGPQSKILISCYSWF